jgi:RNA polymerase sigma-70 factor (TIGR02960 family)
MRRTSCRRRFSQPAGTQLVRGTRLVASLVVPDRDQSLPERASRPWATPTGGISDGRAARANPQSRADLDEPYPDHLLEGLADTAPGPEARYETRESVGLAFVTGLQRLPPRQRAALVLRDVLGFHTAEVADMLESSEASVKGALQRARATLHERMPAPSLERAPLPRSSREHALVGRFAAAVESGDYDSVVSLLTDDARVTMPPEPYEYQGANAIAVFLKDRQARRGANLRLVPTRANGQPAFGCYLPDAHAAIAHGYGMMVLTLDEDRISAITWFAERSLLAHFGLPRTLPG